MEKKSEGASAGILPLVRTVPDEKLISGSPPSAAIATTLPRRL